MSDVLKISGICLICAILLVIMRRAHSEMGIVLKIAISITLMGASVAAITPIISYVSRIFDKSGIGKYGEILIKALCISLISGVCAAVCRDAGEEGISGFALMFGRIQIIILALPLIEEILDGAIKLLEFI